MVQNSVRSERKRRPALRQIIRNNYQIYLLMLPGMIATFVFAYIPIYGVQIAFKNFRSSLGIWGSEWVGLEHFVRFVTNPNFASMIRNTLSITLYSLATFPLTVIVALALNELRSNRFKKVVQMASYAPHFLSTVVLCGLVILFFGRANGIVNNAIVLFGGERVDFVSQPRLFSSIFVWSGVWQNIGWDTIIYLAALAGVSQELIEAAEIDGASRLRIILHVKLPAILPTMLILFIMATGSLLTVGYEKILLLENKLNMDASRVISTYVYKMGLESGQFSYAAAINLFNNLVSLMILIMVNTFIKKRMEVGLW